MNLAHKLLLSLSFAGALATGANADEKTPAPSSNKTPAPMMNSEDGHMPMHGSDMPMDCDPKHMDTSKMTADEHKKIMKACKKQTDPQNSGKDNSKADDMPGGKY